MPLLCRYGLDCVFILRRSDKGDEVSFHEDHASGNTIVYLGPADATARVPYATDVGARKLALSEGELIGLIPEKKLDELQEQGEKMMMCLFEYLGGRATGLQSAALRIV